VVRLRPEASAAGRFLGTQERNQGPSLCPWTDNGPAEAPESHAGSGDPLQDPDDLCLRRHREIGQTSWPDRAFAGLRAGGSPAS